MKSADAYVVHLAGTLMDVLRALDRGGAKAALVTDKDGRLVGIMTDGDVRRALISGSPLDAALSPFVNREFTSVRADAERDQVLELMQARLIDQIPIVDTAGRPLGLHLLHEMVGAAERPNSAVIMAGGKGSRLGPLTQNVPKPMLHVAGRPILERIVLRLVGQGIRTVYLSIHYLGHLVEQHFGDGSRFGCRIEYLREERPLGTGGALALLPPPQAPIIVMNGDLITQANFGAMLDFHAAGGYAATVGVRTYLHTIPFGCVEVSNGRVESFEEKPTLSRTVNAGMYVLSPALVARVPKNQEFPLPELLVGCLAAGEPVGAYEVLGDWIDVGQRDNLSQARGETP
jgi:dTDP-glucose pyrophosphorylase